MEKSEKIYMDALANMLAGKWDITKKEAQQFLMDFVQVIKEGIDADGLVKIKGLGTFKVIDVESRESVNVNTGERVLIEGHQKLTFTPDSLMKDQVNKPFNQFETVLLNEGVVFPDDQNAPVEPEEPEEQPEEPEPQIEPEPEVKPEPAVEPDSEIEPELEMEPESDIAPDPEPAQLEPEPEQPEPGEPASEPISVPISEPVAPARTAPWWPWLLAALVACGLSFGAGYWLGAQKTPLEVPVRPQEASVDTVAVAPADTLPRDATGTPEPAVADQPAPASPQPTAKQPAAAPQQPASQPADWQKYDAMDKRIRLGFYGIVGLDREEPAREGETLGHLSRRVLGPDMECYVEVYNGMKATDVLTAGQKIKIPKLMRKKKLKEKYN